MKWVWVMVSFPRKKGALTGFRRPLAAIVLVLPVAAASPGAAANVTLVKPAEALFPKERALFVRAQQQLDAGDDSGFSDSLQALGDYPLADFLRFQQLQRDWNAREPLRSDVSQLNAFEKRTQHESLTRRLTRTLQKRFADTQQWSLFLGVSKSTLAAKRPCTTIRALHETGQLNRWNDQALKLWVKPGKPHKLCADVLADLEKEHTPPVSAIWEKIFLSMESDKPAVAESMLKYLASRDRKLVQRWIGADKQQEQFLNSGLLSKNTVLNRRIVADLLVDWSRADTLAAVEHWLRIRDDYTFYKDRFYETHQALVMRAAYRGMPEAQGWLEATNARSDDLELQEWRVRLALRAEDWSSVLENIERLPEQEQAEDHWAYWVARSLEQLGRQAEADEVYRELAELQSYYGFLSADRLDVGYAIYDEPIAPDTQLLIKLSKEPALLRAREFHFVSLPHESRREWNNWMAGKEPEEIATAAVLANQWQLHDRAIFAAGVADQRRAISLRFPVLYRSEVAQAALDNRIEPAWIFGVMRRESAYIRDIKSGAGAIGLMQLMPRTANYVAELQGEKNWRGDLTDAATNIRFGSFYLRHVMDRFDDHQVLATASYNAGPHRVNKWLRDAEMAADLWIDTIPFTETRRYVRAVLAYAAIYEHHLTGKAQRLTTKLRTIPADSDV